MWSMRRSPWESEPRPCTSKRGSSLKTSMLRAFADASSLCRAAHSRLWVHVAIPSEGCLSPQRPFLWHLVGLNARWGGCWFWQSPLNSISLALVLGRKFWVRVLPFRLASSGLEEASNKLRAYSSVIEGLFALPSFPFITRCPLSISLT